MTGPDVSRRTVLRSVGVGLVGTVGASGIGSGADGSVRQYSVGASASDAVDTARERARDLDRVLDFGDIGRTVVGTFTEDAARAIEDRDDVRYVEAVVELDIGVAAQANQAVPWGVDRIDADVAHANGHRGEGVHVAVLDTGIAAAHPDLRPNLGAGRAFVDCTSGVTVRCSVDGPEGQPGCVAGRSRCRRDWGDDFPAGGHGTHVAGAVGAIDDDSGVLGVAPGAGLHSVKVTNTLGIGNDAAVAAGLEHVADRGWDVVNMSIGGPRRTRVLADALAYAAERDVVLVAAAGNAGPERRTVAFPARHPAVVAVGATTRDDRVATFSSRGTHVDVAAPGTDVCSTIRGGAHSSVSGTSMASPHVAGVAALLLASGTPPGAVRDRIVDTAEDVGGGEPGRGAGLVDAARALGLDSDDDGLGNGVCNPPPDGEESG